MSSRTLKRRYNRKVTKDTRERAEQRRVRDEEEAALASRLDVWNPSLDADDRVNYKYPPLREGAAFYQVMTPFPPKRPSRLLTLDEQPPPLMALLPPSPPLKPSKKFIPTMTLPSTFPELWESLDKASGTGPTAEDLATLTRPSRQAEIDRQLREEEKARVADFVPDEERFVYEKNSDGSYRFDFGMPIILDVRKREKASSTSGSSDQVDEEEDLITFD